MKLIFIFLALATYAAASNFILKKELETHFNLFKIKFERNYTNSEEEAFRKRVFAENFDFIVNHNREYQTGKKSYNVAVNQFSDMTNEEFRARYNSYLYSLVQSSTFHLETYKGSEKSVKSLPDTVDWTTKGVVTPIKNQRSCGSCWAFSAVASMESQHAIKTGKLVSLSEQNLIDCSVEKNHGCRGGYPPYAFQYVIDHYGIDTEEAYPYEANQQQCRFQNASVGATFRSFRKIESGSESSLQSAVATYGPITVGIDVSNPSFQHYHSGVYDEPYCSSTNLQHGVAVVGYGTLEGNKYWKVKNSWGTHWGMNGYILMSRDKQNQCGIATDASWPVV